MMASDERLRCQIAWLMWCLDQGYTNAVDREILSNWLLDDPATLHPDDMAKRSHLLAMADEAITAIREADRDALLAQRLALLDVANWSDTAGMMATIPGWGDGRPVESDGMGLLSSHLIRAVLGADDDR